MPEPLLIEPCVAHCSARGEAVIQGRVSSTEHPCGTTLTKWASYGWVGGCGSVIAGSPAKASFGVTVRPGAAAATSSSVSPLCDHELTTTSPGSVVGRYSVRRCSVSLSSPVSPKVSPATTARTAATEGALRARCRARSRAAIRSDVGRCRPSRPTPARTTGTRSSDPTMRTTAPTTTRYSGVAWSSPGSIAWRSTTPVPPRVSTAPTTASTAPRPRTRRLGRGDTLWPRITPTMSRRPSRRAGMSAATKVDPVAHTAIAASTP